MWRHNVDLLAYHDLDGRSGLKLALQEADGRFFLYVAGFWHSGWSILEVTDPEHPQLLRWLDGPPNTMTIQVQVADGTMITALEHPPPGLAIGDPAAQPQDGFLIWDVREPDRPQLLGRWVSGGTGTHRNFYNGGPWAYATPSLPALEVPLLAIKAGQVGGGVDPRAAVVEVAVGAGAAADPGAQQLGPVGLLHVPDEEPVLGLGVRVAGGQAGRPVLQRGDHRAVRDLHLDGHGAGRPGQPAEQFGVLGVGHLQDAPPAVPEPGDVQEEPPAGFLQGQLESGPAAQVVIAEQVNVAAPHGTISVCFSRLRAAGRRRRAP